MSNTEVKIRITTAADLRAAKLAEQELRKQIVAAQAAGKAYGHLEAELRRVQGAIGNMGFFGRAKNELLGFAQRIPVLGSFMRSLNGAVGSASAATAGVAAVAAAGTAAAAVFARGVKAAADYGDELSDLSARTGAPIKDLVVLRQALDNAGVGAASAGPMVNLLQRALAGVNDEGQPTAKIFEQLGLSIKDLSSMSPLEALKQISAALQKIENPAQRTAAAMKMFGRSGGEMLPVLLDSAAFSKAEQQTGRLGQIMQDNAEKLAVFSDAMNSTGTKSMQFFAGAAAELAPVLKQIGEAIDTIDLSSLGAQAGGAVAGIGSLVAEAAKAGNALQELYEKYHPLGIVLGAGREAVLNRGRNLVNDGADLSGARGGNGSLPGDPRFERDKQPTEKEIEQERQRAIKAAEDADAARAKYEDQAAAIDASRRRDSLLRDARASGDTSGIDREIEAASAGVNALRAKEGKSAGDYIDLQSQEADLESLRQARQSVIEARQEAEARRETLALETQIAEARAAGDDAEAGRLEWIREYNALLAQGIDHAEAARSINAKVAQDQSKAAAENAEREKGKAQERADEQASLTILRLRAAGQEQLAAAEERSLRARQLARQYEDMGMSPTEAAATATERVALEARTSALPGVTGPGGGPRHFDMGGRDVTDRYAQAQSQGQLTPTTQFTDFRQALAPQLTDALRAPTAPGGAPGGDKFAGPAKSIDATGKALDAAASSAEKLAQSLSGVEKSAQEIVDRIGGRLTALEKKVASISRSA